MVHFLKSVITWLQLSRHVRSMRPPWSLYKLVVIIIVVDVNVCVVAAVVVSVVIAAEGKNLLHVC